MIGGVTGTGRRPLGRQPDQGKGLERFGGDGACVAAVVVEDRDDRRRGLQPFLPAVELALKSGEVVHEFENDLLVLLDERHCLPVVLERRASATRGGFGVFLLEAGCLGVPPMRLAQRREGGFFVGEDPGRLFGAGAGDGECW